MNDKPSFLNRFIKGVVPVGLGNTVVQLLGLISTRIIVREMSMAVFGTFVLLEVNSSLITQFSGFGLNLTTTKYIASNEEPLYRRQLVNSVLLFRFFVLLLVGVLTWIAAPIFRDLFSSPSLLEYIVYLPIIFTLESFSELLDCLLEGFEQFQKSAIASSSGSILKFVLIVIFIVWLNLGIIGLIYARVISQLLTCLYKFWVIPVQKRIEINIGILKEMIIFGFPLLLNNVFSFGYQRFDSLFIGALLGPAEIALYEIARKIPDALIRLYNSFKSVYFPLFANQFAQGDNDKTTQTLSSAIRWLIFFSLFGSVFVLLFGKEIISILFSPDYQSIAPVFTLLMVGFSLTIVEHTLGYSLVGIGQSDKPAYIMAALAAVSLLGNLLLIPQFGILGGAWATVIGFSIAIPLNMYFLSKKGLRIKPISFLKPLILFAVLWGFVLFINPESYIVRLLVLCVYPILAVVFSAITTEELGVVFQEAKSFLHLSKPRVTEYPGK